MGRITNTYEPLTLEAFPEMKGQIVDILEDFLDKNLLTINNPERDREEPDCGAHIWGEDYDILTAPVESLLAERLGNGSPCISEEELKDVTDRVCEAFFSLYPRFEGEHLPSKAVLRRESAGLKRKIRDAFLFWGCISQTFRLVCLASFEKTVTAATLEDAIADVEAAVSGLNGEGGLRHVETYMCDEADSSR